MVVLIVLNIILIVAVIFLAVYLIKNKKDDIKNVYVNRDNSDEDNNDEIKCVIHKQNKKIHTLWYVFLFVISLYSYQSNLGLR